MGVFTPVYPKCLKYVDDLTLVESRSFSRNSSLQDDLNKLVEWSDQNQVRLNPSIKLQALQVCFKKNPRVGIILTITMLFWNLSVRPKSLEFGYKTILNECSNQPYSEIG